MKKSKMRILALVIALVMSFGMIAACGGDDNGERGNVREPEISADNGDSGSVDDNGIDDNGNINGGDSDELSGSWINNDHSYVMAPEEVFATYGSRGHRESTEINFSGSSFTVTETLSFRVNINDFINSEAIVADGRWHALRAVMGTHPGLTEEEDRAREAQYEEMMEELRLEFLDLAFIDLDESDEFDLLEASIDEHGTVTRIYTHTVGEGRFSVTATEIEFVFSDGEIAVAPFSRTENTIEIAGMRYTRG